MLTMRFTELLWRQGSTDRAVDTDIRKSMVYVHYRLSGMFSTSSHLSPKQLQVCLELPRETFHA